jgi:predicted O-methyltransferase YrrM
MFNFEPKLEQVNWFQVHSYISHQLRAGSFKKTRTQSCFVNKLLDTLANPALAYYHFDTINNIRNCYLSNKTELTLNDYGAGSRKNQKKHTSVAHLAKHSSIAKPYGEMLSKVVAFCKPQYAIELGTSLGISTLYLSLPNTTTNVYTIDACKHRVDIAKNTFSKFNLKNIHSQTTTFDEALPSLLASLEKVDLAFIDGNHRGDATLNYFQQILHKSHSGTIIIFDDIHWSKSMYDAWLLISRHKKVSLSLDLFQIGIVFFVKDIEKTHLLLKN